MSVILVAPIVFGATACRSANIGDDRTSSEPAGPSIGEIRSTVRRRTLEVAPTVGDLGLTERSPYGWYRQCTGDKVDWPRRDRTWTYQTRTFFDVTQRSPRSLRTVDGIVDRLATEASEHGWGIIDRSPMTHLGDGGFQTRDGQAKLTVRTATKVDPPLPDGVLIRVVIDVESECVPMSEADHERFERDDLRSHQPLDVGATSPPATTTED